jgi:protocatechuate 3,4-dioxygenase beta subunit
MHPDPRLPHRSRRRDLLILAGAGALGLPAARAYGQAAAAQACVATPARPPGLYFVDERLRRADIRSDPASGAVSEGLPLRLTLRVAGLTQGRCKPVAGAYVDLWHCDSQGLYSDARHEGVDTLGRKFLRGYQVTDARGEVRFSTIYPGWYPGAAVHIHFKIRTDPNTLPLGELTSQFFFDDALTDRVHARAPYARHGQSRMRNAADPLFRDTGSRLMLALVAQAPGYAGGADVVLRLD